MTDNATHLVSFDDNSAPAAAAELLDTYLLGVFQGVQPDLRRMVTSRARTPEDVDDIVSEVFIRVAAARPSPADPATAAYFMTAAQHLVAETERQYWTSQPLAGSGWHPDPFHTAGEARRFFNGRQWTWQCRWTVDGTEFVDPLSSDSKSRLRPRVPRGSLDAVCPDDADPAVADAVDDEVIEHVVLEDLLRSLETLLTPLQFTVLRRSADCSLGEVAEELHLTVPKVRNVLRTARRRARPIATKHRAAS